MRVTCRQNKAAPLFYNNGIARVEGDAIAPQPVMEVVVYKTHQEQDRSSSKDQGVRCLLYVAQTIKAIKGQEADENKLLTKLQAINSKMALAKIMTPTLNNTPLVTALHDLPKRNL